MKHFIHAVGVAEVSPGCTALRNPGLVPKKRALCRSARKGKDRVKPEARADQTEGSKRNKGRIPRRKEPTEHEKFFREDRKDHEGFLKQKLAKEAKARQFWLPNSGFLTICHLSCAGAPDLNLRNV